MQLKPVDTFETLSPSDFKTRYYRPMIPVVMKGMSKSWPALHKWTWDYFIDVVGDKQVGVYNNVKSDSYTPINTADDYMLFGDYLQKARSGPLDLRIFLFNIFQHAPQLTADFTWPDEYMSGFVKKYPMLFVGGQGSITHMHFDIDMSHILHTQFTGRKRVLLFPFEEQHKLYRKPWEVLSLANFANYSQGFDYENFPAVKLAKGYEVILEHGDTLFMPAGYWHHMEYIDAGYAMSLRAMQTSLTGKLGGVWKLFGMRGIDTLMKKTAPEWWYNRKKKQVYTAASAALSHAGIKS
ncbi:MAG TPA: cupin-like domain-containing protein [Ferruginibacter sp.]|nr:cupin-like domain-containing protein [Ferruginibacter sp.]HRO06213.1 cupin-like domain-containing protein [Ferruginibacter sp.]HRO97386.1 cupin-like domain-containing protein [Ferruginibacter sp.]HRP49674.1 cupin-like domain-containing protein [Ferruginibacter sp.]